MNYRFLVKMMEENNDFFALYLILKSSDSGGDSAYTSASVGKREEGEIDIAVLNYIRSLVNFHG